MGLDISALKQDVRRRAQPVILWLDRAGFSPLTISIAGLVISMLAGLVVARVSLFLGALIFAVGSAFDMLDGGLARLQGRVSRRGAFLDSCFDRLGEAALFAGLTWYYATRFYEPREWALLFILGTAVGSITTSYVRARAEGVGTTCYVGLLQRPERVVILVVGMLLGWRILEVVLGFLMIITLATTVQRIVHVWGRLPAVDPPGQEPPQAPGTGPSSGGGVGDDRDDDRGDDGDGSPALRGYEAPDDDVDDSGHDPRTGGGA
jgi:CDP-diacylglycerol--glycerol-3-phosphate 3-phosphatidyltransferase